MSILAEIKGLSKIYLSQEVETRALNSVSMRITAGEFIAVMGPSGCGKSTLLHQLGLLDTPNEGSYIFNGIQAFPASNKQRKQIIKDGIGFVFQQFNLIDELSVFDNVQLPLFYKKWKAKDRKERVDEVLDSMCIGHRSRHNPQQLSGGQQQRVALARAIVGDPVMILADEPTGNLDHNNGRQVLDILSRLNREGKTIVMVTHSHDDASYAHRVLNMKDGAFAH